MACGDRRFSWSNGNSWFYGGGGLLLGC
jgi:hypothetical protein